jgi:hypothetical protein
VSDFTVIRVGQELETTIIQDVITIYSGVPTLQGEKWWVGEGPPTDLIAGASVGDFYWDSLTGTVYELTPGP